MLRNRSCNKYIIYSKTCLIRTPRYSKTCLIRTPRYSKTCFIRTPRYSKPVLYGHLDTVKPALYGHLNTVKPALYGHLDTVKPGLYGHLDTVKPVLYGHLDTVKPVLYGHLEYPPNMSLIKVILYQRLLKMGVDKTMFWENTPLLPKQILYMQGLWLLLNILRLGFYTLTLGYSIWHLSEVLKIGVDKTMFWENIPWPEAVFGSEWPLRTCYVIVV